jgi:dTDP-4-amino-4,6-dideoxygalactose transaminase
MSYLGYGPGSFPETERAAADNLALPLWGTIGADVQEQVVAAVLAAVGSGARNGQGDSVLAPLP